MKSEFKALQHFQKIVQHFQETLLIETIATKPLLVLQEDQCIEQFFNEKPDVDCAPCFNNGVLSRVILKNRDGGHQTFNLSEVPLISSKSTIQHFLERLSEEYNKKQDLDEKWKYWLVLTDTEIDSIVTIADLALPPVSMLLSNYLLYLESLASYYILNITKDSSEWLEFLKGDGQAKSPAKYIKERHKEMKRNKQDLNMIHYATLRNKFNILQRHPKSLEYFQTKQFKDVIEAVSELRNSIAHNRPAKAEDIYQNLGILIELVQVLEKEIGLAKNT